MVIIPIPWVKSFPCSEKFVWCRKLLSFPRRKTSFHKEFRSSWVGQRHPPQIYRCAAYLHFCGGRILVGKYNVSFQQLRSRGGKQTFVKHRCSSVSLPRVEWSKVGWKWWMEEGGFVNCFLCYLRVWCLYRQPSMTARVWGSDDLWPASTSSTTTTTTILSFFVWVRYCTVQPA
jgi:hypothetical protein